MLRSDGNIFSCLCSTLCSLHVSEDEITVIQTRRGRERERHRNSDLRPSKASTILSCFFFSSRASIDASNSIPRSAYTYQHIRGFEVRKLILDRLARFCESRYAQEFHGKKFFFHITMMLIFIINHWTHGERYLIRLLRETSAFSLFSILTSESFTFVFFFF